MKYRIFIFTALACTTMGCMNSQVTSTESVQESINLLPQNWDYRPMFSVPELQLALPKNAEISMAGKGDTFVQDNFYTDQGKKTGTGFAFVLAKDNGDFPPGIVYDSTCDSESKYTVESTTDFKEYVLEKIRTDCGSLVKFLIKKDYLLIRVHPEEQSERVLKIVEQIVSNARIGPEQ